MKKLLLSFLSVVLVFAAGCYVFIKYGSSETDREDDPVILTKSENMGKHDSRFFDDAHLVTTSDGYIVFTDLSGRITASTHVRANWVAPCGDILVYSSEYKETGIGRFDPEKGETEELFFDKSEMLRIDPTVIADDDGAGWYYTTTAISGTVNNDDPGAENGFYSVSLFEYKGGKSSVICRDIVSCQNNIEDPVLIRDGEKLLFVYEKETYDKGPSSIELISSVKPYDKWSEPLELLPATCDQEIGGFEKTDDGYVLYYSSDSEYVGGSYNRGKLHRALFDSDLKIISNDKIDIDTDKGLLVYDVRRVGGNLYYAMSGNYLTEGDLIVASGKG